MTRRALLAAFVARPTPDFYERVLAHNEAWNRFFRGCFGCPPDAREVAECKPHLGVPDYGDLAAARRSAMRLFELRAK